MENTSKPLPGVGAIISDTWKLFTSTWNTSIKTSSLMIYLGLAYFVGGLLVRVNEDLSIFSGIISLGAGIFSIWISIRIILTMLNLEAGKQPMAPADEAKKAWELFVPMLWVGFLTGLVVFGASLLFLLPGIYFAIALNYSQLFLIDQNVRGTQALGASRALVRGRWWGTFGRVLAGGIVFGLLSLVAIGLSTWIIMTVAGVDFMNDNSIDPLVNGILQLVQMVIMAAITPLFVGFQVKMYRALQKTR